MLELLAPSLTISDLEFSCYLVIPDLLCIPTAVYGWYPLKKVVYNGKSEEVMSTSYLEKWIQNV